MKTQIFHSILIAVALMLLSNNNTQSTGYFYNAIPAKIEIHIFDSGYRNSNCINNIDTSFNTIQSAVKNSNPQDLNCFYCKKEHQVAEIPEPNGDHEFHSFHFKHNRKSSSFWKIIVNKTLGLIYLLLAVVAYLPYKIFK